MTEITNENEWFKLIDDCNRIINETNEEFGVFKRKKLLESYYKLGKRIMEYRNADMSAPLLQTKLAEKIGLDRRRIGEILGYTRWVDENYGNFEGFLQYCEDNSNPKLEGYAWRDITHEYLPNRYLTFEEIDRASEEEDNRLVQVEKPLSDFASELEARAYFESKGGVYDGIYVKGKMPKREN